MELVIVNSFFEKVYFGIWKSPLCDVLYAFTGKLLCFFHFIGLDDSFDKKVKDMKALLYNAYGCSDSDFFPIDDYYRFGRFDIDTVLGKMFVFNSSVIAKTSSLYCSDFALFKSLFDGFMLSSSSKFKLNIWQELIKIPSGTTVSYQDLSFRCGCITACRAVSNAVGSNLLHYFIPCHRVIRKSKSLGGFRSGLPIKIALLESEGITI